MMRFTAKLDLTPFSRIIERNAKPLVLANLHLNLKGDTLTLKGTNGQSSCKSVQTVEGMVDGECLVDYYTLKKLKFGVATYTADTQLKISDSKGVTALPLTDIQLYPKLAVGDTLATLAVPPDFDGAMRHLMAVGSVIEFDGSKAIALGGTLNNAARVLVWDLGVDFGKFNLDAKVLGISPTKLHDTKNAVIFDCDAKYMFEKIVLDNQTPYAQLLTDMPISFTADLDLARVAAISETVTITVADNVQFHGQSELGVFVSEIECPTVGTGTGTYRVDHVIAGIKMGVKEYFMNDKFLMMVGDNFKYIVVGYYAD